MENADFIWTLGGGLHRKARTMVCSSSCYTLANENPELYMEALLSISVVIRERINHGMQGLFAQFPSNSSRWVEITKGVMRIKCMGSWAAVNFIYYWSWWPLVGLVLFARNYQGSPRRLLYQAPSSTSRQSWVSISPHHVHQHAGTSLPAHC